jgi:hypothetical protein
MKSWKVFLAIALAIFAISWFIVSPVTKSFSVLSQRKDKSKSSAITDKWDGKGKFIDMIWE